MEKIKTGSVDPKVRETAARIIETCGSEGMPSCGRTDARRLGGGSNTETLNIGGTDYEIEPETPCSHWPFSLLGRLIPHKLPKSPRNFTRWLERHGK